MPDDLSDEEKRLIENVRRSRSIEEPRLPVVDDVELARRLKVRVGLGALSVRQTMTRLGLITQRHPGPRVVLDSTLSILKLSWLQHFEDLVMRGASGPVIRHRREAVDRYCKAMEIAWSPEKSQYERRAMIARKARNDIIELPDDFLDRVDAVIRGVKYHDDPIEQKTYQTSLRVAFKTYPRVPSELVRLRIGDVSNARSVITYRQSKTAGPEGTVVMIPREVFDVPANLLTSSVHMSLQNYIESTRPRLLERWTKTHGEAATHDYVWCANHGGPLDANEYRTEVGARAKAVWPGFYPYLAREVGMIMYAVEMLYDLKGAFDVERFVQRSGHADWATARRYLRKGRSLLREAGTRTDQKLIVNRWRNEI
jgi:hypothetical protein